MSDECGPDDDVELAEGSEPATCDVWDPWNDAALQLEWIGEPSDPPVVFLAADSLYTMDVHGCQEERREVGGILVGFTHSTPSGLATRICDIIPTNTDQASLTHVTFTHDAWDQVHRALDQRDDGVSIVGWYHTHPGFGPFLSAQDLFIHQNFFSSALHVAVVIDPVQGLLAAFGWRDGAVVRLTGCFLYDNVANADELRSLLVRYRYRGEGRSAPPTTWLSRLLRGS